MEKPTSASTVMLIILNGGRSGPRICARCAREVRSGGEGKQRGYGATVARLTPDQKVGSSNLSALIFAILICATALIQSIGTQGLRCAAFCYP